MRELSLHILDIVENGITAGAGCITIAIEESEPTDRLTIRVCDDGPGMPAQKALHLDDPFVTGRTTRRVGLGLSLLAAAARRCEGQASRRDRPATGAPGHGHSFGTATSTAPRWATWPRRSTMLFVGNPRLLTLFTVTG